MNTVSYYHLSINNVKESETTSEKIGEKFPNIPLIALTELTQETSATHNITSITRTPGGADITRAEAPPLRRNCRRYSK
jgi:hypothetical protein